MEYPWVNINCVSRKNCKAVYRIRLVSSPNKPRLIPRLLNRDHEGILMIGQTNDIKERLKKFRRAFEKGNARHSEGRLLHVINTHCPLAAEVKNLEYWIKPCNTLQEAEESEEKLIKNYVKNFGEAPPLNSIIPHRDASQHW